MLQDKNQGYDVNEKASRGKDVFLTSAVDNVAYQMSVQDLVVIVTTVGAYAMAVTLPSVAMARGNIYTFRLVVDGGQDFTLQDKGDDAALTTLTFNDAGEMACLYSDGYKWHTLYNSIA